MRVRKDFRTMILGILIIATLLLPTICQASYEVTFPSGEWEKYTGNPIITGVQPIGSPVVLQVGCAYKMWYQENFDVCYATSSDGRNWQKQGAVMQGRQFALGTVLYEPGDSRPDWVYKMWYAWGGATGQIGFAHSADGVSWIDVGQVLSPESYAVGSPNVIYDADAGLYKMWYDDRETISSAYKISYATSPDGVTWTKVQRFVFSPEPGTWFSTHVTHTFVEKHGTGYWMWFSGYSSDIGHTYIGRIWSADGISWILGTVEIDLMTGPDGSWDAASVSSPWILDDTYGQRFLYYAASSEGVGAIGIAVFGKYYTAPLITDIEYSGDISISWRSQICASYSIEVSTDPYDYDEENNMSWTVAVTGLLSNGLITTWTDVSPPILRERYYRIYTECGNGLKADDTVGIMTLLVKAGRNMVSSPFEPYPVGGGTPGASTLNKIIGNQLTGHSLNKALSDNIEVWDNALGAYKRVWYKTGTTNSWLDWDTGGTPAFGMDADKGYWFNIISGHPAKDVMFCGRVSKTDRTVPISVGRNLVGSCFPVSCTLAKSGLVASGFTGATINKALSDNIEFWNNTTASYDRYWYKTGTVNEWQPWTTGGMLRNINPGDALWVNVISGHSPFTWTYPVPPRP